MENTTSEPPISKEEFVTLLNKCKFKAMRESKLSCHQLQIDRMLNNVDQHYNSSLGLIWVEYFLGI